MTLPIDSRGAIVTCAGCGQKNRIPFANLDGTAKCGQCKAVLPAPGAPLDVSSEQAFDALIGQSSAPVLVDFWAAWCGPCRMVAPEVEKVAAAHAGRLTVAKVDTEALPSVASRFDVRSIPMLALFAGGRLLASEAGARPASGIEQFVSAALARRGA